MNDIDELKHSVDLIAMVESDLGPGRRVGRWTMYRCPFHDDKNPSMGVRNSDGKIPALYKCFANCGAHGDVFSWMTKYRKMSFVDALKALGGGQSISTAAPARKVPEPVQPPDQEWQASISEAVHYCQKLLWTDGGEKARHWLNSRGLNNDTLKTKCLGYSTGLKISGLWIPAGIVIPCWAHDRWWYVKVRRASGEPKYIKVKGSSGAALYGLNFPWAPEAFRVEGEFDQMILWQECRDFTNVFTTGSASDRLDPVTWGIDLLEFEYILDAGDSDNAGNLASKELKAMTGRVIRCPFPAPAKDATDFWKAGGNLKAWAWYQIKRLEVANAS